MTISTADIQPGDLLLFHGKGFVSWAIRKIDGSEVNHTAIAIPDGKLAEAGGFGLTTRDIPTAFSDSNYMLVRKHMATDARDPVLAVARAYLDQGSFYAYQQIVLLAVLGVTRRIPARGLARRMIRSALDHAARALMDLLPVGKSWMICSEYTYRCYDEAVDGTPDPWPPAIEGVTFEQPAFGEESWLDWAEASGGAVDISAPAAFGAEHDIEAEAEEELAPLIAEWAQFAGVDAADPLPAAPVSLSFGEIVDAADPDARAAAEAAQMDLVSDADLRDAMVLFSETFKAARTSTPGVGVQFGVIPGTVVATAAKGALEGLRRISVDPNFVTPRDLLRSPTFGDAERAS